MLKYLDVAPHLENLPPAATANKPYHIVIVCLLSLFFACKSVYLHLLWLDMYKEEHRKRITG